METKLTLENIAYYLPYGLKAELQTAINFGEIYEVTGLNSDIVKLDGLEYWNHLFEIKPLLRPMSQLTQKITIEGKECIPIVELAKIAFPNVEWEANRSLKISYKDRYMFEYWNDSFCFWDGDGKKGRVPNQLQLFQWLYKNKFDVFGLCDAGLALPVTEDNNVYN